MIGYCVCWDSFFTEHHPCLCSTPPARPPTADTSPSRIKNAASANDAASLLALIESVDKYFSITNRTYPQVEITLPEWQLIKSALQQRIEVSGVEGHASANEVPSTQKPTINRAGIYAEMEPRSNPQGDAESVISDHPPMTLTHRLSFSASVTRQAATQALVLFVRR